jgi:hypothetical protein
MSQTAHASILNAFRALLAKKTRTPAVSFLSRRSVPTAPASIPIATQLFLMELSPPMESFCRFLPWPPRPSYKCSVAYSICVFTKPNALQNPLGTNCCHGFTPEFQSMPERLSKPPKSPLWNPKPAISPALQWPWILCENLKAAARLWIPFRSENRHYLHHTRPLEWIHRLTYHVRDLVRH